MLSVEKSCEYCLFLFDSYIKLSFFDFLSRQLSIELVQPAWYQVSLYCIDFMQMQADLQKTRTLFNTHYFLIFRGESLS